MPRAPIIPAALISAPVFKVATAVFPAGKLTFSKEYIIGNYYNEKTKQPADRKKGLLFGGNHSSDTDCRGGSTHPDRTVRFL